MFSMLKRELMRNPKRRSGRISRKTPFTRHSPAHGPGSCMARAVARLQCTRVQGARFGPRTLRRQRVAWTAKPCSTASTKIIAGNPPAPTSGWRCGNVHSRSRMSASPAKKFQKSARPVKFSRRSCSITGGRLVCAGKKSCSNAESGKNGGHGPTNGSSRAPASGNGGWREGRIHVRLAARAAEPPWKNGGRHRRTVDLLIVATITPDMPFPATACLGAAQKSGETRRGSTLKPPVSGFITELEGQQFIMSRHL